MDLLARLRGARVLREELARICRTAARPSEVHALAALITNKDHDEELLKIVKNFCKESLSSRRLAHLREAAVRLGDVDQLRLLLSSADQLDVDQLLTDTLHKAPQEKQQEIISLLLNRGYTKFEICANPNSRYHGKTAFHVASEYGYHDLLTSLLPSKTEDCNAFTSTGETALHTLVRGARDKRFLAGHTIEFHLTNCLKCAEILVKDLNINVNIVDNLGYTAVHLACLNELWDIVQLLIENNANVDVFVENKSARDIINKEKPDINIKLDNYEQNCDTIKDLFSLIKPEKEEKILSELSKWKQNSNLNVNLNNGHQTLLQASIDQELITVVESLVKLKADINLKCGDLRTPLMIAVSKCNYEIVEILLKNQDIDLSVVNAKNELLTVLHLAVINAKPHCQCVKLMCEFSKNKSLNINAVEMRNRTALHLAVERKQEQNIVYLLRNKANIFIKNDEDLPAFAGAERELLQGFLDDQVSVQGTAYGNDENYILSLNFDFLLNVEEKEFVNKETSGSNDQKENSTLLNVSNYNTEREKPEMENLVLLTKSSNYRPLINHPIIKSFLHLKWHRYFWIFYINFIMLAVFTFSLTFYIYFIINESNKNHTLFTKEVVYDKSIDTDHSHVIFQIVSIITLFYLIVREIFQFCVSRSFCHYISYVVNWVELTLIGISGYLLIFMSDNYTAIHTLSAIAVLLAFTELVILIGSHPVLTTYYTMLFRVAKDFLYFLLWYSLLVVAFGISFYILFQHCEGVECDGNLFVTVWTAIFKTTVMLQGEFDANSLKFDSFNVVSHIVFLFFFFSMVIVLMNLLNGLAVSDIQVIKNESELICLEAQIKTYAKFEKILFQVIDKKFKNFNIIINIGHWFKKESLLLSGKLTENKLEYTFLSKSKLKPDVRNYCSRNCIDCSSGQFCCCASSCFRSKHFRNICPLCFEFDEIIQAMVMLSKQRSHDIRSFEEEVSEHLSHFKELREEQKMLHERQNKLELILANIENKLIDLIDAVNIKILK